ncbi:helix-turn-helix domain-containing protein [Crossiella cryophila]|uniref:Transcriptional regulator with XRE-family HTH domain n=1 Tax=Crossiella cryophila TaxID=43355 RepID=A0A7W7CE57_9PSEU|nr:helix-turn-helix transcriptional regulator [Crossiella cryophila]MBB4679527.1 transcriptional regulator with XRE-family HTH domain [Crossiella cryophila]
MGFEGQARRCRCGTQLARDNQGARCHQCQKAARDLHVRPPAVPSEFWRNPDLRNALDARHMGQVIRAFRLHPFHGDPLSQTVVARWSHRTQAQLSRIENGQPLNDLSQLIQWAHILGIPVDLLWFKVPDASAEPSGVLPAARPELVDDDQPPAELADQPAAVLVPIMVGDRAVLVPLDLDTAAAPGTGAALDDLIAGQVLGALSAPTAGWNTMYSLNRRSLLKNGVAALMPALTPDEQSHVGAALADAPRYFDGSVAEYFGRQLEACTQDDGKLGPSKTLPRVLTIISAIDQHARDVKPSARRELLAVGARGAEFAGWLYRDVQDPVRAGFWRDRATEWAQESGDWPMQGYVLLKKAQAAYDDRDALRMLTLAEAAGAGPWKLPIKVRAEVAQQVARGHAMLGNDNNLVERKLAEAQQLLTDAGTSSEEHDLGTHYNDTLLTMQTAICFTEAGRPGKAATLYRDWLSANNFSQRDYGYFLSLMASTLALAGEPDEAARTGVLSATLAARTNSARTTQELRKVIVTLRPWESRAAVRELRETMLTVSPPTR